MLEELKKQVLEYALESEKHGLCYPTSGNFSAVDRENNYVVITPKGKNRNKITYDQMVVIDFDGNIIEAPEGFVASSENLLHLAVYKAREDINCVGHTHSPYACVFAALNREILPVLPEANRFDCRCPLAPYETPGSPALADSIVKALGEHGVACVMGNHGVLAASRKDMYDLFIKLLYIEDVARTQYQMSTLVGLDNIQHMSVKEYDKMMIQLGKKEYAMEMPEDD